MNIKHIIIGIVSGMAIQVVAATPTVSDVVARQRYPWNGMVDIDYTITGDASGCVAEITVEDRQGGKTYTPTKFLSVLPTTEGRHRVTWSTEAEGVTIISTNVAVTVALVTPGSSEGEDDLCYVVDLSGGPTAERYPVTTMRASPTTVWSDEYKTTKLVLRRVKAGDDPLGRYTVTKPFFVGVFEVTQKQYELIMGRTKLLGFSASFLNDVNPMVYMSYDDIRGSERGSEWPSSTDVDSYSFIGVLRSKTGICFDIPTEAQWEYACRAGTASKFNNGGDAAIDLSTLGRYEGNVNDGRGGTEMVCVGSYAPNAWGLYDMHGNAEEKCLDWYGPDNRSGDDPVGLVSPVWGDRVVRGGCWLQPAEECVSGRGRNGWQSYQRPNDSYFTSGFRIVCPIGL